MPGTLDFSVVIVSWNVKIALQDCLESIFSLPVGEQPRKVFVVDNASNDGTVAMIRQHFPIITLIANTENKGFAAANNQAIAKISNDDVLLLNPDTVVHPGAFPRMIQALVDHPKAGIVGPKLLNADGTVQPSVRRLPTTAVLMAIALKMRHWWPSFPPLRRYMATDIDVAKEQCVGQVMGAAFLIRRSVLDQVGILDENFHVWFEEVDYCKRATDAGWETWYVPAAKVTHIGGQSFGQLPSVEKQRQWSNSVRWYSHKHFSAIASAFLSIAGHIGVTVTWCAAFLQRHTLIRLAAIPVLLALLTGIASSQVGYLSDDWDWNYEARMTQQDITRPLTHNVGGAFYRPLVTYSFALQYKIAPYNIPVARTIQTLLFTTTVVLLVAFVWQMTGNAWVSTTSGALFSVWPPHHEVTTWLAGRPDLLSLLWILASLVTFHAAIRKRSIALYALTVLFASAAVLSKETGIIAIPALLYVVILRKKFRDWRVWVTVLGSAAAVCFFLFVRSIVLGQLVGSYGETQVRTSLANGVKLFRTIFEGWVNWAWLGAKFTPRIAQLLRYFAVVVLGASVLTVVALHWRSMKKEWKKFAALGVWFLIAVSLALVMVQSVNTMDLSGTRHLYLASSVLAVTIAYLIAFFKARRRIAFTVVIIFAIAWLMNVQPWVEASAENNRILTQIQLNVPNPPTQAVFDIRGLPGDTFGAYQWYAKRSIPEAVVALYHRPDLYAPTALETSPYCSPYPNGKVVRFFYTRATRNLTFLGVHDISVVGSPPAVPAQALTVTSPLPGTYVATATPQSWQGYRGLVITLDAVESGFVQLQIRGEGSTLYNRPVVRVESGRNDVYFSLCEWHAWLRSIPKREVKILTPISTTVTAAHLVAPYAL